MQRHLNCCGWHGPADFAYTNDPIDESCYETVVRSNSGIWPRGRDAVDFGEDFGGGGGAGGGVAGGGVAGPTVPTKKMKEEGCGDSLVGWFRSNKLVWASVLASLFALQAMAVGIAIYILARVKRLRKLRSVTAFLEYFF